MGRPRLVITSDADPFDPTIQQHWDEEGYDVRLIEYKHDDTKAFAKKLIGIADDLYAGEKYALVAYGAAASEVLRIHRQAMPKLCALVVYYPTEWHAPNARTPLQYLFQAHLVEPAPEDALDVPAYVYAGAARPGFAERGSGTFDKVSANLAWSRTLGTVRKGFGIEADLERTWEEHLKLEFATKDADATMKTMVAEPYVNHIPTVTGGIGYTDLHRFYRDFFVPSTPPSMQMRLLSRTIGVDRVVDEMYVSFVHSQEIPWLLPGVPPTNLPVEIALVSVVCIRGGKLYHEHIYWDQASVLVQIGLLDPKIGTVGLAKYGVDRLPVVGAEAARKVVDEESVRSNDLMPGW